LKHAVNDFAKTFNSGSETNCLFLDFSKAFDKVPNCRLLLKLDEPTDAIPDQRFFASQNTVSGTEGNNSDAKEVLSGVLQGSVLAPLLFTCYVNDIPSIVSSKVR